MEYQEWKRLKSIKGEDTKRVIRDFELSNPYLTEMYEQQKAEEEKEMRQAMKEPDRMERWKQIARMEDSDYEYWKARRERELR